MRDFGQLKEKLDSDANAEADELFRVAMEIEHHAFEYASLLTKLLATLNSGGLLAIAVLLTTPDRTLNDPAGVSNALLAFGIGLIATILATIFLITAMRLISIAGLHQRDAVLQRVANWVSSVKKAKRWTVVGMVSVALAAILFASALVGFFYGLLQMFLAVGVPT